MRLATCPFEQEQCVFIVGQYLQPQAYILWGYLKENMYTNKPHSLDELKQDIQKRTLNVRTATENKVASSMSSRVDACPAEHVGRFQHLLCHCKCNLNLRINILNKTRVLNL